MNEKFSGLSAQLCILHTKNHIDTAWLWSCTRMTLNCPSCDIVPCQSLTKCDIWRHDCQLSFVLRTRAWEPSSCQMVFAGFTNSFAMPGFVSQSLPTQMAKCEGEFHAHINRVINCPKNPKIRDIAWNGEENEVLHEIFRIVSRFPATRKSLHLKYEEGLTNLLSFSESQNFV